MCPPHRVGSRDRGGGYAPPQKNAHYVQKSLNLVHTFVYFCYLNFERETIVDSKLRGDIVQATGAGRVTPVSGRLPGITGDLGPLLCTCVEAIWLVACSVFTYF